MNIAIIPARGGSKRIPKKNIKLFNGRPMISYAIDSARKSELFDHIVVSTDDKDIKEISIKLGAEVPFDRPSQLADDYTPTVPVIRHAINQLERLHSNINNVCTIYPCVPLINTSDINNTYEIILKNPKYFCFPITEFTSAIQRSLKIDIDKKMKPFYPQFQKTRTQDLEKAYYDTGLFYWGKKDLWLEKDEIHHNSIGFEIPNWRVVDIDNQDDWQRAEFLYKLI